MSKFLQRIDTDATKFAIEIHLTKVEISLVQQCRISVILKRGKHERESNSAPLEKGEAMFDERLNIPATLFYVKKKDKYLPKEAALELHIVTPSTKRLAGLTKFDLAHFANLGLQEQEVVLKVDRCFDKNAKFHFKIHLIPLKENVPVVTKLPFSRQNVPEILQPKGHQDLLQIRRSRTHTSPQKLNMSEPPAGFDGLSSVQNLTFDSLKIPTGQTPNRRTRSPGSKFEIDNSSSHEQVVMNRRSKTVDMGKHNESSSLVLGSAADSHTYVISEKSYDAGVNEHLEKKVQELENQVQVYQIQNKNLEERASVTHQNYINLTKELEDMKVKYHHIKEGWDHTQKNGNKEPEDYSLKIAELENRYNIDKIEFENKCNQEKKQFENKYKQENKELERNIADVLEQLKQLTNKNQKLENANKELSRQLQETLESTMNGNHLKESDNTQQYEIRIKQLEEELQHAHERNNDSTSYVREAEKRVEEANEEIKETENKAQQAIKNIQELEKKIKELNLIHENDLREKEKQIQELQVIFGRTQSEVQEKNQKIEDLEVLIRSYESEIELLKKVNKSNSNDKEDISNLKDQVENLEARNKKTEESYKKRVDELIKQNSDTKRELEYVKGLLSEKEREVEGTMAQVGLENEKMKRQIKELNAKILTMQYDAKEAQQLRERVEELQTRNEIVEAQLSDAKMKLTSFIVEKENTEMALKDSEDNNKLRQDKIDMLEMELFQIKAKLGEIINSVMETGDEELLDTLESILAAEDIEYHRNNSKRNE